MNKNQRDPEFVARSGRPAARPSRVLAVGLLVLGAGLSVASCASTVPNREPLGERFPRVNGDALDREAIVLPLGEPSILLVGYVQDAQFDADRWLMGLLEADLPVRILELPTIEGLFPRIISGTIDAGMRSGIPEEDWPSVVPLFGAGAERVIQFTGNETPRNIRTLLLDAEGQVLWFHDRGFSAAKLLELERTLAQMMTDRGE